LIRRHIVLLRAALMAADALVAVAAFTVAAQLRFGDADADALWRSLGAPPPIVGLAYALLWVAALWSQRLYRLRANWSWMTELRDILRATVILAFGTLSALFLLKLPDVSRLFLVWLFIAQPLLTLVTRLSLRAFFGFIRQRGMNTRFVLVIGTGGEADRFADSVERHRQLGLQVVGHLRAPGERRPNVRRPILGSLDELERMLHEQVVDEVAICLPLKAWGLVDPVVRLCQEEGKIVRIPLDAIGPSLAEGRVEEFEGAPILSLLYGPDRVIGLAAKRLVDLLGSVAALLVLSPVILAVAIAILVFQGGPVLFRQMRVGLHGRPFTMLKFRTMIPGAEEQLSELLARNEVNGHAFKLAGDPRLTSTGRWLRRFGLDELPQLLNVVLGEMSLVGPRPPLPREVAGYGIWHRRRLSMKPGITGLWQIGTPRVQDFDRWVELDLAYIDRWSLWLDLKIMLRTIPAMLHGNGR
jgi:exopolysaccharide biosynthesis polyprenyl glycosylphosphotransferase